MKKTRQNKEKSPSTIVYEWYLGDLRGEKSHLRREMSKLGLEKSRKQQEELAKLLELIGHQVTGRS